jgi:hypothetical protein
VYIKSNDGLLGFYSNLAPITAIASSITINTISPPLVVQGDAAIVSFSATRNLLVSGVSFSLRGR